MIKVIFFDAGGTLFRPFPSVGHIYAVTALKHGVSVYAEQVEIEFNKAWHLRNGLSSLSGQSSEKIERDWWYGLVRDVFGNLDAFQNFDLFFEDLYDLFASAACWRLFDDSIPVLDDLKKAGYRLAIISNWDQRLFSIVEQLGLKPYFETVIASSSVGVAKPGKAIFDAALKAMTCKASESLHIGDSLTDDYHGARSAGLKSVLLDRHGKAYNGIVKVTTLRELPALLTSPDVTL